MVHGHIQKQIQEEKFRQCACSLLAPTSNFLYCIQTQVQKTF
jgi:hypothetical protein